MFNRFKKKKSYFKKNISLDTVIKFNLKKKIENNFKAFKLAVIVLTPVLLPRLARSSLVNIDMI